MFGRTPTEQQAFCAVVDAYQGALLGYVARILSQRSAAEDVVQNVLVKCAAHWKGAMEPGAALAAWLYRVAHNEAVDHNRRDQRRWRLQRRQAEDPAVGRAENADDHVPISDRAASAADALGVLTERERQLVVLKVYEEKSYREIAEIAGLSVGNVGFILHGAMRKLEDRLRRAEGETSDGRA